MRSPRTRGLRRFSKRPLSSGILSQGVGVVDVGSRGLDHIRPVSTCTEYIAIESLTIA